MRCFIQRRLKQATIMSNNDHDATHQDDDDDLENLISKSGARAGGIPVITASVRCPHKM